MSSPIIEVANLSKKYRLGDLGHRTFREQLDRWWNGLFRKQEPAHNGTRGRNGTGNGSNAEFWALRDITFTVQPGEVVGIIGRNGAGKSTLLKILSRITEPTSGDAILHGRVASLLEVGTGFHPELTGRENIYLNGAILGMKKADITRLFDEIVAFAEIEEFIDTPVKRYSSGMYVRLAFAVAAHLEPEILILDEVLAVGDVSFQKKCLGKMEDVSRRQGRTVLFVSHNLQAVRQLCNRALFLRQGELVYSGDCHTAIRHYMGPDDDSKDAVIDLSKFSRPADSFRAQLLRAEFTDGEGRAVPQMARTSDLIVKVWFRIDRPLVELEVAMAVVHVEGQRVFSEIYSDQFGNLELQPGEYSVQFSLPLHYLKIESYFLALGLYESGTYCDSIEGLPLPELVDPRSDHLIESRRWGVVRIPVTWSPVEPVVPEGAETSPTRILTP